MQMARCAHVTEKPASSPVGGTGLKVGSKQNRPLALRPLAVVVLMASYLPSTLAEGACISDRGTRINFTKRFRELSHVGGRNSDPNHAVARCQSHEG